MRGRRGARYRRRPRIPATELSRFRRENDRLRMERDILKKAVAIFSEPPR